VPVLHGISREHYATMHATQLFFAGQVYPMLMSSAPHAYASFLHWL